MVVIRGSDGWVDLVAESISDPIAYVDADFVYRFANSAYLRFWKKTADQLLGTTVASNVGQDLFSRMRPELERCLRGEHVHWPLDAELKGTSCCFDITLTPFINDSDQVDGILMMARDISDVRALQLAQAATLQELQLALDTAHLGVWRQNMVTGRMDWSDELFRIYGVDKASFRHVVEDWRQRVHPDDLEAVEARFSEMASQPVYDVCFRIVRPDGAVRHVSTSGLALRASDGSITEFIGVNQDITERKQQEESLRQAAAIFSSTSEAVVVTNLEGRITDVNPAFCSITGFSRREALGRKSNLLKSGRHDAALIRPCGHPSGSLVSGGVRSGTARRAESSIRSCSPSAPSWMRAASRLAMWVSSLIFPS
ncbi:GGDEF and EAL domain-containing protein [Synechococcus sp. RSCCF101]|uniref:PAS domain-containing protein n=1 Tax=Synechococcus sp. RSCCF101 TaxID=2511069 RepID=UPI0012470414|nr:PAS domain-containing protein [Synechococcus sp. RSCCF101]QEY32667.1 GGDEF and EAL domain-containing protein [Synechococcus sp. RSCCF101]